MLCKDNHNPAVKRWLERHHVLYWGGTKTIHWLNQGIIQGLQVQTLIDRKKQAVFGLGKRALS